MTSSQELFVLLDGSLMGCVTQGRGGRFEFRYDESWLGTGLPLSLSMPLEEASWPHALIEAWMWGVLPDNDAVLQNWGRHFGVSARNPFALLRHMGEDCPGAVQFLPSEKLEGAGVHGAVDWLEPEELDARLVALQQDATSIRRVGDRGFFSLAGAQAKIALLEERGRFGVPSGRTPTNRILKPAIPSLEGSVENEHFCLRLARSVGFEVAHTRILATSLRPVLVVERYDRIHTPRGWVRVHQEDACQALGIHPRMKYESEGGPGMADILERLDASSQPARDRMTFLRHQLFHFLIGGTDAHAKNTSFLLHRHHEMRLAPLYDVLSAYPYFPVRELELAMRVARHRRLEDILPRHWEELARHAGMRPRDVLAWFTELCEDLPGQARTLLAHLSEEGLFHPRLETIVSRIEWQCERQLRFLAEPTG